MKHLIAALAGLALTGLTTLTGCTTPCPTATLVSQTLMETYAGHGGCGNYKAMASDITASVAAHNFCKIKSANAIKLYALSDAVPSGDWSYTATACLMASVPLSDEYNVVMDDWGCSQEVPLGAVLAACAELE